MKIEYRGWGMDSPVRIYFLTGDQYFGSHLVYTICKRHRDQSRWHNGCSSIWGGFWLIQVGGRGWRRVCRGSFRRFRLWLGLLRFCGRGHCQLGSYTYWNMCLSCHLRGHCVGRLCRIQWVPHCYSHCCFYCFHYFHGGCFFYGSDSLQTIDPPSYHSNPYLRPQCHCHYPQLFIFTQLLLPEFPLSFIFASTEFW